MKSSDRSFLSYCAIHTIPSSVTDYWQISLQDWAMVFWLKMRNVKNETHGWIHNEISNVRLEIMCVLFHDISISVWFFQQFKNECKLMNELVETHLERIQMLMRICWQWTPDQSHCHQALKPETLMGRWEVWPEQFLMDKKNIVYHNGPVPFFLSFFLCLCQQSLTITFSWQWQWFSTKY